MPSVTPLALDTFIFWQCPLNIYFTLLLLLFETFHIVLKRHTRFVPLVSLVSVSWILNLVELFKWLFVKVVFSGVLFYWLPAPVVRGSPDNCLWWLLVLVPVVLVQQLWREMYLLCLFGSFKLLLVVCFDWIEIVHVPRLFSLSIIHSWKH